MILFILAKQAVVTGEVSFRLIFVTAKLRLMGETAYCADLAIEKNTNNNFKTNVQVLVDSQTDANLCAPTGCIMIISIS